MSGALSPSRTLIFINYRTCDEPFAALYIDKRLSERFGPGRVFRDSRTIQLGAHFPDKIRNALLECRAMIVVIGKRWLRVDSDGQRMIDKPHDYVRMEIAEALRRDIVVVPVLVGDVSLPPASALPASIAGLVSRQYRPLRVRDADTDTARLVEELLERLGGAGLPPPRPVWRCRHETQPPATVVPPVTTISNEFYGLVDARKAIFGNTHSVR
jgi:TIR domain